MFLCTALCPFAHPVPIERDANPLTSSASKALHISFWSKAECSTHGLYSHIYPAQSEVILAGTVRFPSRWLEHLARVLLVYDKAESRDFLSSDATVSCWAQGDSLVLHSVLIARGVLQAARASNP